VLWWLLLKLRFGTTLQRCQAAFTLKYRSDARAVPWLIHALNDRDANVTVKALYALESMKDFSAVTAILNLLDAPDHQVRKAAAQALGKIGDVRASGPLLRVALSDYDGDVRNSALIALKSIGTPEALVPLGEALAQRQCDDYAICSLAAAFRLIARRSKISVLPSYMSPMKDLVHSLENAKTSKARSFIIPLLGEFGDKPVEDLLVRQMLDNEDHVARQACLQALKGRGWTPTAPNEPLLVDMRAGDPQVAFQAALTLAPLGNRHAKEFLIAAWVDSVTRSVEGYPSEEVAVAARKRIVAALSKTKDRQVVDRFRTIATSGKLISRIPALAALEQLGWKPCTTAERIQHQIHRGAFDDLVKEGEKAVPLIVEILKDVGSYRHWEWSRTDRHEERLYSVLARIGRASAITALRDLLSSDATHTDGKLWAVKALSLIPDETAAHVLFAELQKGSEETRFEAAAALAHSQNVRAIGPLVTCLLRTPREPFAKALQNLLDHTAALATDHELRAVAALPAELSYQAFTHFVTYTRKGEIDEFHESTEYVDCRGLKATVNKELRRRRQ
jgi:HEAT repeat protein